MPHLDAIVVDDDDDISLLLARRLERLGLHVRVTAGGWAAIALAAVRTPDIVLLDLHLPDIDGAEMVRGLRAAPTSSRVPLLVVSIEEPWDNQELDVDGWLVEPFRGLEVDDEVGRPPVPDALHRLERRGGRDDLRLVLRDVGPAGTRRPDHNRYGAIPADGPACEAGDRPAGPARRS